MDHPNQIGLYLSSKSFEKTGVLKCTLCRAAKLYLHPLLIKISEQVHRLPQDQTMMQHRLMQSLTVLPLTCMDYIQV